jgi:hypothetical protein
LAPIFTSFSRSVVSDQFFTPRKGKGGHSNRVRHAICAMIAGRFLASAACFLRPGLLKELVSANSAGGSRGAEGTRENPRTGHHGA